MKLAILVDINYIYRISQTWCVKIAQAPVRQAKLATFSVETLIVSPTLFEFFVYMTRLGSAQ